MLGVSPLQRTQEFSHLNSDLLFIPFFQDKKHDNFVGKSFSLTSHAVFISLQKEHWTKSKQDSNGETDFSQIIMFENRCH